MTHAAQLPFGQRTVMAQRREPPDSLDFFPTPPWATRALFEHVLPQIGGYPGVVWEPACGAGHMARVIEEYAAHVTSTDIWDYGYGVAPVDFLSEAPASLQDGVDWIITNPPFNTAMDFALLGLQRARVGVALLCRTQWIEGGERYYDLFKPHPPTLFAPFVERVPMVKGRWDPDASTATSYAWFVWHAVAKPRAPYWIPPQRRTHLTKSDDRERFAQAIDLEPMIAAAAALKSVLPPAPTPACEAQGTPETHPTD